MYTISIDSVYHSSTWTESYTTRRAARRAFQTLYRNSNFGDVLILSYNDSVIKSVKR